MSRQLLNGSLQKFSGLQTNKSTFLSSVLTYTFCVVQSLLYNLHMENQDILVQLSSYYLQHALLEVIQPLYLEHSQCGLNNFLSFFFLVFFYSEAFLLFLLIFGFNQIHHNFCRRCCWEGLGGTYKFWTRWFTWFRYMRRQDIRLGLDMA